MATQSLLTKTRLRDYSHIKPLPDPPRVPDMMEQIPSIFNFLSLLKIWFKGRDDVFVGSSGYLWRTPKDGSGPYPDGTFVAGIQDPEWLLHRNGYVISEVGKPPDLVLEVGSESTGRRDYTAKREIYAEYGVREYWRFDATGGSYHDAPLAGDRLVDGRYEPMEVVAESDGRHWGYSEVLGLEIWWDGGHLRLRDPVSGEFIRTIEEYDDALVATEGVLAATEGALAATEGALAATENALAVSERARIAAERARRIAEARAESERAELEAEIRRLRGE